MKKTEEEKEYEQLRKLGQKLHIPIPEHFIELEVTDKDGKVIQRHKQRSHSWTRNSYNSLLSLLASINLRNVGVFGAGLVSFKDTGGTIRASTTAGGGLSPQSNLEELKAEGATTSGYRGGAANDESGILIGSGANIESFEDFVLQTKIIEGNAAGQMNYTAQNAISPSYDAGTKVYSVIWVRYFNNNSPGNVNINEVALVPSAHVGAPVWYVLYSRDKLGATVTVPAAGQLKTTYTLSLTFPA